MRALQSPNPGTLVADGAAPATPPAGFVVSDLVSLALVVLAVTGAVTDRPVLAALGAVVLVIAVCARIWTREALRQVGYSCELSTPRAVAGDTVTLTVTLENHKRLPVPWLRVREAIPPGLVMSGTDAAARGVLGTTWLEATTLLGPWQRVRLRYRLEAGRRGHYLIGPARLRAGDPFGFYESERFAHARFASLTVYPSIPELPSLAAVLARPVGEVRVRARIGDDPTLPVTVREYRAGDAAGAIDWKATARRGAPWVRVNDASVDGALILALECDTRLRGPWDDSPQLLEKVVATAAAVAKDLLARGHTVGLVANGVPPGDQARVAVAPGAGRGQLMLVLDALARVQSLVVKPLPALVNEHAARVLPFGATLVCIAGVLRPDTAQMLATRAASGTSAVLVYLGDDEPEPVPGVRRVRLHAAEVGREPA
jgi:uncharacterized protein (DUF58 family)